MLTRNLRRAYARYYRNIGEKSNPADFAEHEPAAAHAGTGFHAAHTVNVYTLTYCTTRRLYIQEPPAMLKPAPKTSPPGRLKK